MRREGSGGAGRYRGGLGVERVVRARTPITMNTQIERAHCRPWGLGGGSAGTGNDVALRLGGTWKTDFPNAKVLVAGAMLSGMTRRGNARIHPKSMTIHAAATCFRGGFARNRIPD